MQKPQLSFVGLEVVGSVEFEFVEDELKPNAIVEIFGLGNTFQIERNMELKIYASFETVNQCEFSR